SGNDLVGIKFQKYFKRYFPNQLQIFDCDEQFLSIMRNDIFEKTEYIIINSLESKKENVKKIVGYFSRFSKIIIIQKSIRNTYRTFKNITLIKISNFIGFNDRVNEIQSFASAEVLIDYFIESIVEGVKHGHILVKYDSFNSKIISQRQKFCSLRLLYQGDPNENIFLQNVGNFRIKLGEILADYLNIGDLNDIDYIVPVPSSGIFYAVGLSKALKIPMLPALKKIQISERAFEIQDVDTRKRYLYNNMEINSELIKNKNIILVDEAIFTGATLKVVCDILKDCDVSKIHLAIPSPKCFLQCDYLVQPKRILLLKKINERYLSNYFNVNSVNFLPLEQYAKILNKIDNNICYECFLKEKRCLL
ncbi:glutamine amidophosphoribosyltransferase, partial [Campylobacter coli]|nr:glutamine amidophosphoribosyltransferase [Campylobacter coli]EAJ2037394.1 glutamine amidophosphoribosyltransferase [Campylobacter coli]EIB1379435.1 amidophosphoribosyltransferase [Campylobacter coli]HAN0649147.1 glutamine amidophosphoribosyltransferase [Campylobacter coli]